MHAELIINYISFRTKQRVISALYYRRNNYINDITVSVSPEIIHVPRML